MGWTTTTASNLFEQDLHPAIIETFQEEDNTFAMFEDELVRDRISGAGRDYVFNVGINASFGSLTEGAQMPIPGSPSFAKGNVTYTRQWKTGEMSVDILKLLDAPNGRAKFLAAAGGSRANPGPVRRDTVSFRKVLNEFVFGTGNGQKGVIAAGGVAGTTITFGGDYLARQIPVGMRANWYDASGVQRTGGGTSVSTVLSKAGAAVTFDAVPNDLAATDIIVYENSYSRAPYGLPYFITDASTTILGVNTGTYPDLKSNVIDLATADVAPGDIDLMVTKAANRTGYNAPTNDFVMISHRAQQDKYRSQGYLLDRTVEASGNKKLDLGFPMVAHNGMRWKMDVDSAPSDIWFLRLSTWRMEYVEMPGTFDLGGERLFLKPGTSVHFAAALYYLHAYYNLVCTDPRQNGRIKSAGYDTAAV